MRKVQSTGFKRPRERPVHSEMVNFKEEWIV